MVKYSLFECDIDYTSISDIISSDFDYFKRNGYILSEDYSQTIKQYYDMLYDSSKNIPFYCCLPILNSLSGENKFKFIVVDLNDDKLFFAYKVIQIVKTKQIRIFDIPISLNNNHQNVADLIEILLSKDFVKIAFNENMIDYYKNYKFEKLVEYDNYYYTRKSFDINLIPTWKLNKWGVNLFNNSDFQVLINDVSILNINNIRNDFNNYLKQNRHIVNKNDDKTYMNIMKTNKGKNNLRTLSFYYNNKIIYLRCFYSIPHLKVAYVLYDMQARFYDKNDKILDKFLSHNMVEKVKYQSFACFKDIDCFYILGCRPSEHRLITHKANISDGKLSYFITTK